MDVSSDLTNPTVLERVLVTHLMTVVGDRDPYLSSGKYHLVQHYLREQLGRWGAVEAHSFTVRGQPHTNWILKLPPADPRHATLPPILVGAHYDSIPGTPGADDNASGVAALLAIAHHFAQHPARLPVWCVAFDMEEYGLLGSQALAHDFKAVEQPLRLMLSLEMIGYCDRTPHSQNYPLPALQAIYPNRGDFIALIGNLSAFGPLRHLQRHLKAADAPCEILPLPQQGHSVPDTRLSDHAPFWDAGYRAIMVTDTSFMRNPHYHKASDRLETLDLPFMTRVCLGLMHGLARLR
ncbi:MAG: M28 family peptidase [Leptolyngbyaceae cyanobacterium T60_A2020_046]|nr:M28 family peptidase [Leptolyngbyaceae cyanobacterium T60_A2020_046]